MRFSGCRVYGVFKISTSTADNVQNKRIKLGDEQEAQRKIRSIPKRHPFDERYSQVANIDWDSCSKVLDAEDKRKLLAGGW